MRANPSRERLPQVSRCRAALFAALTLVLVTGGCRYVPHTPPPGPGAPTAPVSLVMTDLPPAGITVLAFQLTVTGATLQPGNVSLLSAPMQIELTHLQTDFAFLSTTAVPAGNYTSITLTLANPVLTIENDSPNQFNVGNTACGPGTVCVFTPGAAGAQMFSAGPFPLTVTANTPVGLLLDVNLANLINPDASVNLSAANGMTVSALAANNGAFATAEQMFGTVANLSAANNLFTLMRPQGNLTINVNAATVFSAFNQATPACNNSPQVFGCMINGQIVKVNAAVQTSGALMATTVQWEDDPGQEESQGVVVGIGIGTPPQQFDTVIHLDTLLASPVTVGAFWRNQYILNGTTFGVDNPAINISGFPFASASDIQFGQELLVRVHASVPGGNPPVITSDRIKLSSTRLTATVLGAPVGANLVVNNLPTVFTANGIVAMQVQTSALTEFQNVASVSGLANGNTVSLRGPIFQTAAGVVMAAEVVRKH